MKKLFITDYDKSRYAPRELFAFVRPFLNHNTLNWEVNPDYVRQIGPTTSRIEIAENAESSDIIFLSEPLTHNPDKDTYGQLSKLNDVCRAKKIFAHAFISGDYGKVFPRFDNIIYYRLGGFKSQLDDKNKGFFFLLSDHLKNILGRDDIELRRKKEKPIVGFCGHAAKSPIKAAYEKLKLGQINAQRILAGDFCFEPLFASAFERYKILDTLEISAEVETNFILRKKYRAGAVSQEDRLKTTHEYYSNILNSDYIVCLRGSGNFSVRLYETLMMGRIPVFVNTDCLLPLEDEVDWKKHVVWVEWKDRKAIAEKIVEFHGKLTTDEFTEMQSANRKLWREKLTVKYFLSKILTDARATVFSK